MGKIIAAALLSILLMSGCTNNNSGNNGVDAEGYTTSNGTITGADMRECMCCGGWFVEILPNNYRIWNMPARMDSILWTRQAPVNVKLSWKKKTDGCGQSMNDLITVKSIELR